MQEIYVSKNEAGQRLDKLLHKLLPAASSGFLYKMLRKKNITLNDKKAEGKENLRQGDVVRLYLADETYRKFGGSLASAQGKEASAPDFPAAGKSAYESEGFIRDYEKAFSALKQMEIVYEDEDMLIVNKPSGILSQKAARTDVSVNEWLIGYLLHTGEVTADTLRRFKPSVCNRLDRNTSGLLLCGKSLPGSQHLNQWVKERKIRKFYRLFVAGGMREGAHVKGFLTKNERTNRVRISAEAVKDSVPIETVYRPLKQYGDITYVEVELITGKTHQIRAHLASLGHPLIGDYKYGNAEYNKLFRRAYGVEDQLLHAYRLEFPSLKPQDFFPGGGKADPLTAPIDDPIAERLSGRVFYAQEPEIFAKILQTYRI